MLKIDEVNGFKFIAGDFKAELENNELNGLKLINCEIEEYDEDGVYFRANGYNSKVLYSNNLGEIVQVLLDEYQKGK